LRIAAKDFREWSDLASGIEAMGPPINRAARRKRKPPLMEISSVAANTLAQPVVFDHEAIVTSDNYLRSAQATELAVW